MLLYCFTVDTDSDAYFGTDDPRLCPADKGIVGWKGLEVGRTPLLEALEGLRDAFGHGLNPTWFVRCDRQVGETHGDPAHLLRIYEPWWRERLERGDDVQWHAHLYVRDQDGRWVFARDPADQEADLRAGYAAFRSFGLDPVAVRIGESFHTPGILRLLRELGLRADCTAMPGRRRRDAEKDIDWTSAPNRPYRPREDDPRQEGGPRGFWEIPMSTVPTQVSYDARPLLRYVDPAFNPGVLDQGLAEFLRSHHILVSIMHPFEILPEFNLSPGGAHPLLAFEPGALRRNLDMLLTAAENAGQPVRFVTMRQLVELLEDHERTTTGPL